MSMDVTAIAESMGMDSKQAEAYLMACDEAIISDEFMATRKGNKVHLAIRLHGLGGRMVLSRCREILARWHQDNPVLLAPVRHGNDAAVRVAEALGFRKYGATITHVWLAKEAVA
jgi:hypothetical protein